MVVDEGGIRMIKILDLFSGTQSVKKALDLMNIEYEYYGIDIYSPEDDNIILDLSQDNIVNKVIAALPKGFIPNFIWASPVCNKFSIATAVKGGNVYFEKTRTGIKVRENLVPLQTTQFKNYTLDYIQQETSLHLKLVENMEIIIQHYDCDFVIENPSHSYMKNVLDPMYCMNRVDYCRYGYDYKKPTIIFSNHNLDLKLCNHKGTHGKTFQSDVGDYADRASVPPKLIIDILTIFLGVKKKEETE